MDKTFEDIITETLGELSNEESGNIDSSEADDTQVDETNTNVVDDSDEEIIDSDDEDETDVDDSEDDEQSDEGNDVVEEDLDEDEEEVAPNLNTNSKDASAFAKLRTENKQYRDVIEFFDSRAKAMGLEGVNDLIAKTQEAELAKQAKQENIPVEYLKKLRELEDKVNTQEQEKVQQMQIANETRIKNSLDGFVEANKLDEKTVRTLANDLIADGITMDFLANVPDSTINRILKSYLPNDVSKQRELEKKEKAKKELPLSSKSNTSTNTQEDDIDKIAKMLATMS